MGHKYRVIKRRKWNLVITLVEDVEREQQLALPRIKHRNSSSWQVGGTSQQNYLQEIPIKPVTSPIYSCYQYLYNFKQSHFVSFVKPRISAWGAYFKFWIFPFKSSFELITVIFGGYLCLPTPSPGTLRAVE